MRRLRALVVLVLTTTALTLFALAPSAGAQCIQTIVTDDCFNFCPPRFICTM